MFDQKILSRAADLLARLRTENLNLATAESCTGGLIAALFTEIPGASDVIDRGFVTYSNAAKTEVLGVAAALIEGKGAVSREVAVAMAEGAVGRARSGSGGAIAVSVTGVAGPGGGSAEKPVGLVHLAVARTGQAIRHRECRFGDIGRSPIRMATVAAALELLGESIGD